LSYKNTTGRLVCDRFRAVTSWIPTFWMVSKIDSFDFQAEM